MSRTTRATTQGRADFTASSNILPRKTGFKEILRGASVGTTPPQNSLKPVPPTGIPGETKEARFTRLAAVGTLLMAAFSGVNIADEKKREQLINNPQYLNDEIARSKGNKANVATARDILSRYTTEDDRKILRNVTALSKAAQSSDYINAKSNFLFIGEKLGPTNDREGLGAEFRGKFAGKLAEMGISEMPRARMPRVQVIAPEVVVKPEITVAPKIIPDIEESDIIRETIIIKPAPKVDEIREAEPVVAQPLDIKQEVKELEPVAADPILEEVREDDIEIPEISELKPEAEIEETVADLDIGDSDIESVISTDIEDEPDLDLPPLPRKRMTLPEPAMAEKEVIKLREGERNRPDAVLFSDTPIMHAIRTGSEEKVSAVIDSMRRNSANNQQAAENLSVYVNENGENCIHLALRCSNPKVTERVLEDVLKPLGERKQTNLLNKKSADYRDIDGQEIKAATPLEIAEKAGRMGMITGRDIATEAPERSSAKVPPKPQSEMSFVDRVAARKAASVAAVEAGR